jgi:hypothetical protein
VLVRLFDVSRVGQLAPVPGLPAPPSAAALRACTLPPYVVSELGQRFVDAMRREPTRNKPYSQACARGVCSGKGQHWISCGMKATHFPNRVRLAQGGGL